MKVAVLGRGLAGCFSALHYAHYAKADVEMIHDSGTPPQIVGQGTFPDAADMLWDACQLDWNHNPIRSTVKTGILYEGWGKKNDEFFHPFPLGHQAVHYDTTALQDYVVGSGKFKVTDRRINAYDEIDADYVFDCRGFPEDYSEYIPLKNPVDSVILGLKEGADASCLWTRSVATPDGWCFVIPLQGVTSHGYIYNSEITTKEEATRNFQSMFDIDEVTGASTFKHYVARQPIRDERIILQGNRLFFLEPLEATAVTSYITWNKLTYDWLVSGVTHPEAIMHLFKEQIQRIQNFILYHYLHGSRYDTPFWEHAATYEIDDPIFFQIMDTCVRMQGSLTSSADFDVNTQYGCHKPFSFKNMHEGLGVN